MGHLETKWEIFKLFLLLRIFESPKIQKCELLAQIPSPDDKFEDLQEILIAENFNKVIHKDRPKVENPTIGKLLKLSADEM